MSRECSQSPGAPADAIRVSHRLGRVWFAGRDRVAAPSPALAGSPWMQIGVVPLSDTDGVEGRLVVCDAELARHALAWRMDAPENRDNVFIRLARSIDLVERVDRVFGAQVSVILTGVVRDPLAAPRLEVRSIQVGDDSLGGAVRDGAIEALEL